MTDATIRLGVFFIVLAAMLIWETLVPNRTSPVPKKNRWMSNFTMMICGALVARIMLPLGLAAIAFYAQQNQLGLFNSVIFERLHLPYWLVIVISIALLDCMIYWQHRMFHRVPLLWRIHRVHHADPHLDASTGLRFHPLEIALSLMIKFAAVIVFGIPVEAIVLFEILLNASSIFNHANIALPDKVEWPLRKIIVTQAMHRIHHSQRIEETDSNFGFNLSIWDGLFRSYTANAKSGDEKIKLGLKEYSTQQTNTNLWGILLMPFRKNS